METDLLQYLPDWFRGVRDLEQLAVAEGQQMEAIAAAMDAVRQNLHVGGADAGTVGDWEGFLHITPNPAVETLEFRRARIVNRLSSTPPFSLRFLYERLDLLIGKDKWAATVDYPGYTIYVEAAAENQAWAGEVLATVNTVKPCHIVYVNKPLLLPAIALTETVGLKETVFHYRLGYWGLGRRPFAQKEDRGVIVTPEQRTLKSPLMADTAVFAAGDVVAARLNGMVTVAAFDRKSAEGDTATIEYTVTPEQVREITRIELLNAAGATLEDAPVYVPVDNPVQITHRIRVKEGT